MTYAMKNQRVGDVSMTRVARTSALRIALAGLGAWALLGLSACSTQIGKREIDQQVIAPAVETRPDQGGLTTTPQAVPQAVPTRIITRPISGSGQPRTLAESSPNAAVLALSQQADAERAAGHADQAESTLGRALRIDPNNPFLWSSLANVHLSEQLYELADNEARRSNSLAKGNPNIEAANWRIVAEAAQARGDSAGALQARASADDAQRRATQP